MENKPPLPTMGHLPQLMYHKTFSIQMKLQFIPRTFFWFWKPGGNAFRWGAQTWELLPNSVTLHTTNTSVTFLWDQHPYCSSRPAFPKPNGLHLRTLWVPSFNKSFYGWFVINPGSSLLGLGVHRDPHCVPVLRGPGLTGTTVWQTGNDNSSETLN